MSARVFVAYAHDLGMTAASFVLALYLRLGNDFIWRAEDYLFSGAMLLTAIAAIVYWRSKMYRGIWRYASLRDFMAITRAVSLVLLIFVLFMFLWTRLEDVPRSIPFINWLLLIAMLCGPRVAYRIVRDRRIDFRDAPGGKRRIPVVLVGASDGAELFIRSQMRVWESEYRIMGIISEKLDRVGQEIHGIPIVGSVDSFRDAINRLDERPQRIVLTKNRFDGALVRELLNHATGVGATLCRLPRMTDFRSGEPDRLETRPVDIEDLLGRSQTALDKSGMAELFTGKRVLITGVGGSIGSEIARQVAEFDLAELVLVELSEYALYQIDQELGKRDAGYPRRAFICDVRDPNAVERIFSAANPEIVLHAAALKHVPLVETNPCEGALTNAVGTRVVADACVRHQTAEMVVISTDKAINPTNVMGATKRIAELYCQALDLADTNTNFVTVRFGNVLGSTGSVVPLFQNQIAQGGPVTVTHPEMTRYFMTVREAVELVLMSATLGRSDHTLDGKVFVLDMGTPIKILDLARQMIRLSGLVPDRDIAIEFSGIRPGEKLFEEIAHRTENITKSAISGILVASPATRSLSEISVKLDELADVSSRFDEDGTRKILKELVPDYVQNASGDQEGPARN